MSGTVDADTTDELYDDPDTCRDSCHFSVDDDDDDLPRILIVCQVPDAVFEEQQAQVSGACLLCFYYW